VPIDECTPEIIRDVSGIGFVLANMTLALILAFEKCRFEVGFILPEFQGGSTLQSAVCVSLDARLLEDQYRNDYALSYPLEREKKVSSRILLSPYFFSFPYDIFNFLSFKFCLLSISKLFRSYFGGNSLIFFF